MSLKGKLRNYAAVLDRLIGDAETKARQRQGHVDAVVASAVDADTGSPPQPMADWQEAGRDHDRAALEGLRQERQEVAALLEAMAGEKAA